MKFRRFVAQNAIRIVSPYALKYAQDALELYNGPREKLELYQKKVLKDLLLYAYEHTKYYNEIFDEINLIENWEVNWSNFNKIPILTKEIIKLRFNDLISNEKSYLKHYTNTSGGSTGEPILFYQDNKYFQNNFGNKILFGLFNDKFPGDKEIKLWGSEQDILEGSIGLKEKIINYVYNRKLINSFVLTEEKIEEFIYFLNQCKPKQVWTYSDSIYEVAKFILETKRVIFSPPVIITTAGMLYPDMRSVIQRAFANSMILDQYGSREVGAIGMETDGREGIRIFEHSVYVEVYNSFQKKFFNNKEGELIITNLTNRVMPLIRYNIGDIGYVEECHESYNGCFKVIKNLQGRTNCHIYKKDGSLVHGEYFTHLFYNIEWLKTFKVIQKDYFELEILMVIKKNQEMNQSDIENIIKKIEAIMGKCQVDFKIVDNIPKLSSGKYQYVMSEVKDEKRK